MIIELIKGVAFLLALCFLQSFIARRWRRNEIVGQVISGLLFGGICVVGMAAPLVLQPGIIFDARSAILSMAGLFGGPVVGFVATSMAAAFRLWLGGTGAGVGVGVIVTSVFLGLIYRSAKNRFRLSLGVVHFFVFGLIVHIASIAWFLLFPPEVVERVFSLIALPFIATFSVGTAILGFLLQDIEHRTAVEKALAESENRFRRLYNDSPVMMHSIDTNGVLVDVNEHWLKTLGYTRSEVIGRKSTDFFTEESRKLASEEIIPEFFRTGFCSEVPYHLVAKSGDIVDVLLTASVEYGPDSSPLRSLSVLVDVTERNRSERLLKQKTEELDRYFESSLDLLCIADTDGYFRRLNREWERVLGYTVDELVGTPFLELVHPEDHQATIDAIANLTEQHEVIDFVNRYRCKDGSYSWLEWRSYPSGKAIFAVARDITQRIAAEAALKESEERFAKAFRASPAPMSISNLETGLTLDVNDEWLAMLGYTREEAIGKTSAELGAWTDETRRADFVNRLKEDGSLRDFEATVVTKNGEKRRVILAGETIDKERMLLVFHDITERLAMQRQLAHAQRMEAVGQLTGGLAHDLNNVLAIISGNVEFLKLRGGAAPQLEHHADAALQGVRRAGDLTRKLLDFSRTDAGITQRVTVDAFIRGMENLIAKSLTPAINLEMELSENGWAVDIDPGDLEAALVNLALNARDAMPNGGTLLIETANKVIDTEYEARNLGSSAGEFVMISVSDTGIGMAPEIVEKAFEPFFTTKEVGKGTGLGLSMVYAFVQRSGGHAKIYSEAGRGTTVKLYLPRATGTEKNQEHVSSAKAALPIGDETILIVDDEPQIVDAAVSILKSLGYQTRTASDASECLDILKQDSSIDLVFSDVIMPGPLDGYHLAMETQRIRPGVKVLLTSGFTRKREEFLNGKGEGAAELASNLLHKPYSMDELANAIRQVLDRTP